MTFGQFVAVITNYYANNDSVRIDAKDDLICIIGELFTISYTKDGDIITTVKNQLNANEGLHLNVLIPTFDMKMWSRYCNKLFNNPVQGNEKLLNQLITNWKSGEPVGKLFDELEGILK